uniref:Uncharacterized protein n=1 Tax=Octopus bimaculoides TaxID=37653 RepID=A0A0L8G7S6_OCTBM
MDTIFLPKKYRNVLRGHYHINAHHKSMITFTTKVRYHLPAVFPYLQVHARSKPTHLSHVHHKLRKLLDFSCWAWSWHLWSRWHTSLVALVILAQEATFHFITVRAMLVRTC